MRAENVHDWLIGAVGFMARQPFLLLILVVGVGYALGSVKVRGFALGATSTTIVLGLAVSTVADRLGIPIAYPDLVSDVFFYLFIFAVGIRVGPQFWLGVKREGARFAVLGLIAPLLAPALAWACGAMFHLPRGSVVGLLGGAMTSTPTLGGAQSALASRVARMPEGTTVEEVSANLSTAFAITYVVGMAGFLLLMKLPPKLSKTSVRSAAREIDGKLAAQPPSPGTADALAPQRVPADIRVYRVENDALIGETLASLRAHHPRGAVLEIRRRGRGVELRDDLRLERGDEIAIAGRIEVLVERASLVGPEVARRAAVPIETAEVVVTRDALAGTSLAELQRGAGHGLYLGGLFRAGDQIPATVDTALHKGDVLRVTGDVRRIEALAKAAGAVSRSDVATDIVFLTSGLAIGAAIGAVQVDVAGVRLSLGIAGGLLLTGLFISVLRTRRPQLGGPFPEPARRLLEDLGLVVFVAVLGLNAGAELVEAVRSGMVVPLLIGAVIVGIVPPVAVWLVGARIMKMNAAVLFGAVAGAATNSAGLRTAEEDSRSHAPAIGFPVPFAFGTILLTLAGYVLMLL